ncbi:MAG: hypothetical protein WCX23_01125 [Candidatus Paceibacterota bacterium]|jgi:hypothetical protein|nr:hypothetical protein [Candidatus Paceibacterota bacterium]
MDKLIDGIKTQKRRLGEEFLSMLHFGFSASPQIFPSNAILCMNEIYLKEARILLRKEEVKTAINPAHALSVAKVRQLGLPVKIPEIKPYTRIAPGGSIIVMQPIRPNPVWMRGCGFSRRDVEKLKVKFLWIRVIEAISRQSFLRKSPFN